MNNIISKIKDEKEVLEANIQMQIGRLLEDFRKRTGLSPYLIDINMVKSDTFGEEKDQYFVGKVKTFIEI